MVHTQKKSCVMQVFWPWQRSRVSNTLHHAEGLYLQSRLSRKCFVAPKPFPPFPLLPSSSCFLGRPFPLSLFVLGLSLISDPFFMHYSITLNSHLQCTTSSHLSQSFHFSFLPSVTLLPSFPPSLSSSALRHFSSTSPRHLLYYLFVLFSAYVILCSPFLSPLSFLPV